MLSTSCEQLFQSGLSLGAGKIRPLFNLSSWLLKKNKNKIIFLSPSVDCTYPINKMIKLTKKPLNFLMQSLQFLIPGKVWGILSGMVWMPSYLSPAIPTGSPATLTREEDE
jgi:hypothetical protein